MKITCGTFLTGLMSLGIAVGLVVIATPTSATAEPLVKPVSQWYEALKDNDAEMISMIVNEEAMIELRDLDITQSRTEFIDALDQWQELNGEAEILTRQASANADEVVAEVCYRFTSSEAYYRETFSLAGNRISGSVQEKLSDTCENF